MDRSHRLNGPEGEWRWVDGGAEADQFWRGNQNGFNTNGAYHNFEPGQPNDAGSNEDVIRLEDVTGDGSTPTTPYIISMAT